MKANELRIGNLFIEEHSDKIIEVIGIEKNRIIFSGMFLDKWQAKPIPLTEEWLLKFGFEKHDEFLELQINDDISIIWVGYLSIMIQGTIGFMNESELIYVHQLQNLYFALTGEELILNA